MGGEATARKSLDRISSQVAQQRFHAGENARKSYSHPPEKRPELLTFIRSRRC